MRLVECCRPEVACVVAICATTFLNGCSTSTPNPPAIAIVDSAVDVESQPLVPRAEFVNWSQFPIGTTVTYLRTTTNEHGEVTETTISKLVEKSAEKVAIETQVNVHRENRLIENPPLMNEFAASFRLPKGMLAEQFSRPSRDAKELGTESMTILGKEYTATVYSWSDSTEAGPISNRIWRSDDFPGRSLRQESDCSGTKSVEIITALEIPKNE